MAVSRISSFTPEAGIPYNMCTGFAPTGANSFTAEAMGTSGDTVITLATTAGVVIGMSVFGTGIQNNTIVTAINGFDITLSRPITADLNDANINFIAATNAILRSALISIVSVNLGGTTLISAWAVPPGEDANPENWTYFMHEVLLSSRDSFETFKIAVNVGDKVFVQSDSGHVNFYINGIYDIAGTTNIFAGIQEPASPQVGDIWIDTSEAPPINKYWSGLAWEETGTEGPTGPANNLTIGTVTSGDANSTATASITGTTPNQVLNLTLKQGPTGPQGTFDIFETPPTGPTHSVDEGDVWFNASDGRFYVRYDGYWVESLSNQAGPTGPRGPAGLPGINPTISVTGPITITGPATGPTIGFNDTAYAKIAGASFTGAVSGTTASFTGTVTGAAFSTTGAVSAGSGTVTGELTARSFTSVPATTTASLDFATQTFKTISIAATTTFTASGYQPGRSITVRVTSDATQRTLNFPAGWVFIGIKPTAIAASKVGILTITSFGTTEAECVAAWAVQQ